MILGLLRDLQFICIFIDPIKSELLTLTFWHFEDLSSYQTITLLLQSQHLNKLRLAMLATTVYLSQLPNPTPSHHLSSNRLSNCKGNKGCFIFFTWDWKKNNRKHFLSVEIGSDILIYVNTKQVFQIDID